MKNLDKITVTIPTLNEETNIKKCIQSIKKCGIKKIIVIDGGSTDNTLEIISKFKDVKCIKVNKKGLAFQRMLGVKKSKTEFTALIDADMRPTKRSFQKMLNDLVKNNYAGVEAFIISDRSENYFEKSYQEIMNININKLGPRRMIGTPTLWYTKILKKK